MTIISNTVSIVCEITLQDKDKSTNMPLYKRTNWDTREHETVR